MFYFILNGSHCWSASHCIKGEKCWADGLMATKSVVSERSRCGELHAKRMNMNIDIIKMLVMTCSDRFWFVTHSWKVPVATVWSATACQPLRCNPTSDWLCGRSLFNDETLLQSCPPLLKIFPNTLQSLWSSKVPWQSCLIWWTNLPSRCLLSKTLRECMVYWTPQLCFSFTAWACQCD